MVIRYSGMPSVLHERPNGRLQLRRQIRLRQPLPPSGRVYAVAANVFSAVPVVNFHADAFPSFSRSRLSLNGFVYAKPAPDRCLSLGIRPKRVFTKINH